MLIAFVEIVIKMFCVLYIIIFILHWEKFGQIDEKLAGATCVPHTRLYPWLSCRRFFEYVVENFCIINCFTLFYSFIFFFFSSKCFDAETDKKYRIQHSCMKFLFFPICTIYSTTVLRFYTHIFSVWFSMLTVWNVCK